MILPQGAKDATVVVGLAIQRTKHRSWLMFRFAIFLLALVLTPHSAAADTVSDCTQDNDVEQKFRACTKLIEENPQDQQKRAHGHLNRGNAYQFKRDFDAAIIEFNQAIRLYPNAPTVYYNRGNAYQSKNDFDRSISDYNEVIRLAPDFPQAYNNRGRSYQSRMQLDRAIH